MNNIFAMFVHWGFYSQLKIQEQVVARFDMDNAEYEFSYTEQQNKYLRI